MTAKSKALVLDDVMKYWGTYKPLDYSYKARPYRTYKEYVSDVFAPLERLQRSASTVKFLYQRDVEPGLMDRGKTASSLSPSQGLPASDRTAARVIPMSRAYTTKSEPWRRQYEFQLKNPTYSYTRPMRLDNRPLTPRDTFDAFFAYKRYELPKRIYRPVSMTRWQYGGAYSSGKLRGCDVMSPFTYTNYDRVDDRRYMHMYFQVRSYGVPYAYRQYMRLYQNYDPKRVLIAY